MVEQAVRAYVNAANLAESFVIVENIHHNFLVLLEFLRVAIPVWIFFLRTSTLLKVGHEKVQRIEQFFQDALRN